MTAGPESTVKQVHCPPDGTSCATCPADLQALLACPACGGALQFEGASASCTQPSCKFAQPFGFPVTGGQPVLIDFDNSIVSPEQASTAANLPFQRQPSRWRTWIKNRCFRSGAVQRARGSAQQFLAALPRRRERPIVLILGGAVQGIGTELLLEQNDVRIVTTDILPSELTDFISDGHRLPLVNGCIDGVWIQYVLEHVLDPAQVVAEMHRVLGDDGVVFSETPFMQQVHAGPFDFTRFTHSGHRWLFRRFEEIDSGPAMGLGTKLLWMVEHSASAVFRSRRVGKALKLACSPLQFVDAFASQARVVDCASSFYFLGRKSTRTLRPADMIDYYRGGQRWALNT